MTFLQIYMIIQVARHANGCGTGIELLIINK